MANKAIDRFSRLETLTNPRRREIEQLSSDERQQLLGVLQDELQRRQQGAGKGVGAGRDISQRISTGIRDVGDIFLRAGGVEPPGRITTEVDDLNEFITKEILKGEIKKRFAEPKISALRPPTQTAFAGTAKPGLKTTALVDGEFVPIRPYVQPTPEKVGKLTESKRKVIGILRSMMGANAPLEEIEEYIRLKGYEVEDFPEIGEYTPTPKPPFMQQIIGAGKRILMPWQR